MINTLDFMNVVDDVELAKRLEKAGCELTLQRILAGRGDPREPGEIIADSLPGWHNPERVNAYFRLVFPTVNVFSNEVVRELEMMWQLRHSIVHTAGVITREDAIKVSALQPFRDRRLRFSEQFIPAVSRRFHVIVQLLAGHLQKAVRGVFNADPMDEEYSLIESITGFDSPRRSWFRKTRAEG